MPKNTLLINGTSSPEEVRYLYVHGNKHNRQFIGNIHKMIEVCTIFFLNVRKSFGSMFCFETIFKSLFMVLKFETDGL